MLACFIKYFLRKINVLQQNIILSQLSILLFIFLHFSELNIDAFCTQFICLSVCESQAVWARVCVHKGSLTFKIHVTAMSCTFEPAYKQVELVSGYFFERY